MSTIQFTTVVGPDGVIRPPAGIKLPEGRIEVAVQSCAAKPFDADSRGLTHGWLLALAAEAERDAPNLPADMAENHDRYAAREAELMNPVFADAFYYIAMLNPADRFHPAAIDSSKTLIRPVVTTVWVLMEVADALSNPAIRDRTHRFLQMVISDPKTTIVADVEPWLTRGMALYGSRLDKEWSLTDCISFEVMTDRGIAEALTGDHHFTQAGFQALLLVASS